MTLNVIKQYLLESKGKLNEFVQSLPITKATRDTVSKIRQSAVIFFEGIEDQILGHNPLIYGYSDVSHTDQSVFGSSFFSFEDLLFGSNEW